MGENFISDRRLTLVVCLDDCVIVDRTKDVTTRPGFGGTLHTVCEGQVWLQEEEEEGEEEGREVMALRWSWTKAPLTCECLDSCMSVLAQVELGHGGSAILVEMAPGFLDLIRSVGKLYRIVLVSNSGAGFAQAVSMRSWSLSQSRRNRRLVLSAGWACWYAVQVLQLVRGLLREQGLSAEVSDEPRPCLGTVTGGGGADELVRLGAMWCRRWCSWWRGAWGSTAHVSSPWHFWAARER